MPKHNKYSPDFIAYVIEEYTNDPCITQASLAKKHNVPVGTMCSWLKSKTRGLTPFQRYKRNRDNVIRARWEALQRHTESIRMKKKAVAESYGLTQATVYGIINEGKV